MKRVETFLLGLFFVLHFAPLFASAACDPVTDEYSCVGTAQAPTASTGACINAADYAIWTTINGTGDGYSKFQNDLKVCASYCQLGTPYNCGFPLVGLCCLNAGANEKLCCNRDCLRRVSKNVFFVVCKRILTNNNTRYPTLNTMLDPRTEMPRPLQVPERLLGCFHQEVC